MGPLRKDRKSWNELVRYVRLHVELPLREGGRKALERVAAEAAGRRPWILN